MSNVQRNEATPPRTARLPPRWFVVTFWHVHRLLLKVTHGRVGLWRPKPGGWGALRLAVVGRRSGRRRTVVVGYIEDGTDLVAMAMNGWGAAEPAWWLNLQERLWSRWAAVDENLDAYAARRPRPTAVVVFTRLEPGVAPETR